jgi:hypothetical protein
MPALVGISLGVGPAVPLLVGLVEARLRRERGGAAGGALGREANAVG